MGLFREAARAYLTHRLTRGQPRRHARSARYGRHGSPYGRLGSPYARRGRASRSGFRFFGPLPTYSRRTRGGSRVSVTGCCLPIPLVVTGAGAVALREALRPR